MSVQRGDLVAGRYRADEPLGPAWRAHEETSGTQVLLVPLTVPEAGTEENDTAGVSAEAALDTSRWQGRPGVLPVTGTATGDAGAWLVTGPIAARTLASAVAEWGGLPAEQVLLIAAATVTALAADGPRIAAETEHILLADDGRVLLLPIETAENDLAKLGAALFQAAEGHTPASTAPEAPRQPTLTALISGLKRKDQDRSAVLAGAFAELSRLGAPVESGPGADTLNEAQAASAAAAEDDPEDDPEATQLSEAVEDTDSGTATQAMSVAELLAETGETEAVAADEADEADEADGADEEPSLEDSADDTVTDDTGSAPTEQVAALADDADTDAGAGAGAGADTDATQQVPAVAADEADQLEISPQDSDSDAGTRPTEQTPVVAEADSAEAAGDADEKPTQQVPALAAAEAERAEPVHDADEKPTEQVPALAAAEAERAEPVHDADEKPTQQVPALAAEAASAQLGDAADEKPTEQVPALAAAEAAVDAEATQQVPTLGSGTGADAMATRPVPVVEAASASASAAAGAAVDAGSESPTEQFGSPDAVATRALPIPSAVPEPSATLKEPLASGANPFVGAQGAAPVPPTQAAEAVPQSSAPPTQAAAAVAPPGSPNPWIQQPQQAPQPQPQPQPGAWQQQQSGPWGPGPAAGQPPFPPGQQPYFPQQGPPPSRNNGAKTAAVIVGAVVAVAAVVSFVVVATRTHSGTSDNLGITAHSTSSPASSSASTSVPATNFPSSSATTPSSGDSAPTDSSSDTSDPSSSDSSSPSDTSTPFDPTSLNAMQTDKTPLDVNALVPQTFTDAKGVHYSLKAGSVQPCVQTDMSSNMQDILTSNSCDKEIAAAYVDDSGQYLVSVKVLPLPDQHTATTVYNDLSQQSAADFGIWCPASGTGSAACDGDYQSATIKQYREQQHRYIILSVALAVNHSQSTQITPWLDAAAKKAVDTAGPDNWSGNQ